MMFFWYVKVIVNTEMYDISGCKWNYAERSTMSWDVIPVATAVYQLSPKHGSGHCCAAKWTTDRPCWEGFLAQVIRQWVAS